MIAYFNIVSNFSFLLTSGNRFRPIQSTRIQTSHMSDKDKKSIAYMKD